MIIRVYWFIMGLFLGSFYNVIAMRSLDNRDWVKGRSECDSCHHSLGFFDLIPLVGFILHKGKCRYCGAKIPIQHLLSEIGLGFVFCLLIPDIRLFILISVLWINLISDIMEKTIITKVVYSGIIIEVILNVLKSGFSVHFWMSLICIGSVILINFCFTNKDTKFGLGDVDVLLLLIVYNGFYFMMKTLMLGCVLGLVGLLPLMVMKKVNRKTEVPLMPFIFLGIILGAII